MQQPYRNQLRRFRDLPTSVRNLPRLFPQCGQFHTGDINRRGAWIDYFSVAFRTLSAWGSVRHGYNWSTRISARRYYTSPRRYNYLKSTWQLHDHGRSVFAISTNLTWIPCYLFECVLNIPKRLPIWLCLHYPLAGGIKHPYNVSALFSRGWVTGNPRIFVTVVRAQGSF